MKVQIKVLDGKPQKYNFNIPHIFEGVGKYGLELAICVAIECYYGRKRRMELEDILKIRLTEEEIEKNFKLYMEKKR